MTRDWQGLQFFTERFDHMPHGPWVILWRTKPTTVWDSPGCQVLPSPPRCLMSHMALAEAGARQCTVAQEPPALACTPAYPGGNPLRRLMGLLLLCRRAATPRFLQAFLSGHHWLTHNGYRHQNQAVPPLLCGSQRLFQCWKFCLVQSLQSELFPSVLGKRRQKWNRSWQLSVAVI